MQTSRDKNAGPALQRAKVWPRACSTDGRPRSKMST